MPGGGKGGRKEGDWRKKPSGGVGGGNGGSKGKRVEMKAGDWVCTGCQNLNFARRSNCNRCGMQKN